MIIYRYDTTGLFITAVDVLDEAPIPPLSTFLPPPDLTPNEAPFAVFHEGTWRLERTRPTVSIHSSLSPNATLEAFQAKTVLSDYGLLEAVKTLINHSSTPMKVKLAWENAVPFKRDNPLVLFIAQQLGISANLLDEMFAKGMLITTDTI